MAIVKWLTSAGCMLLWKMRKTEAHKVPKTTYILNHIVIHYMMYLKTKDSLVLEYEKDFNPCPKAWTAATKMAATLTTSPMSRLSFWLHHHHPGTLHHGPLTWWVQLRSEDIADGIVET